jgi:hypothetical protein
MMHTINLSGLGLIALLAGLSPSVAAEDQPWMKSFDVDPKELVTIGESPYFILKPGFRLTLEGKEGSSVVRLVITVLDETKKLGGTLTRIVEERELKDGVPIEISRNYFAINSRTKDVYYFGEEVDMFKHGKLTGHEGAWAHGSNGAHFGLMMPGTPVVGLRHFQELAPEVAMDRAEIVSVSERVTTKAGVFEGCLKTKETTPLEMFAKEYKLYARGVGLIREGSLELVSYGLVP